MIKKLGFIMSTVNGFSGATRFLFMLAAFVIVVAGMRAADSLMVTFLLSGFFAIICAPPFLYMAKKGLPQWLSLILVVVFICLIQLVFISIITTSLNSFSNDLPVYQERLRIQVESLFTLIEAWGVNVPKEKLMQYFDPSTVFRLAINALGNLGGVLSNSFLIILTVIFMLFEGASLPAKLNHAFGDSSAHMNHIERFLENVKQYMTIKVLVSIATGAVIYIWLQILGVEYPMLWALIAFLLNFVPNIGSIIAAVPTTLLALIQLGPLYALLTALGYLVTNMVMGNVVEPRYLGRELGLSTLVVFLSLVFWGWVLGPVGMLLSVPLTMLLKIAFESSSETQWLAILMGPDLTAQKSEMPSLGKLLKLNKKEKES
ncbi:MAG: AI-2 transport protein TqsA [Oleiphilaceae bacterium]